MRILFIGDIVGKIGRKAISTYLPKIKQSYRPTVSIVNAENAAHGKGLTEKIYKQLLREGVDFMTMGNHTYGQKKFMTLSMMHIEWFVRLIFQKKRQELECVIFKLMK